MTHPHTFTAPATPEWQDLTTEQRRTAVLTLIALDQDARQMANSLGTSRDAILGFCNRQDIQCGQPAAPIAPAVDIGPDGGCAPELWQGQGIPWLDAPRNACRWPLGDDAKHCCGETKTKGSYCARHAAIAYVRPTGTPMPVADMPWGRSINRRDHRAIVHGGKAQKFGGSD